MTPAEAVGRRARELRVGLGLSKAEVGRRMGWPYHRVWRLEEGHHDPQLGTLVRLASALGVGLPELLGGVEVP